MNESYVSLIIFPSERFLSSSTILSLDKVLSEWATNHEIILVDRSRNQYIGIENENLFGPVTILRTKPNLELNASRVEGLGRASGDFVIEWLGSPHDFTNSLFRQLLEPTERGIDLVEFEVIQEPYLNRVIYKIVNLFRPSKTPVRNAIGRMISRRGLGQLLSAAKYGSLLDIQFAELTLTREVKKVSAGCYETKNSVSRIIDGVLMASKSASFGTFIPIVISIISGSIGLFAAIYALSIFVISGRSPEGWTTLMIVLGFTQSSALFLLGLLWTRIDSLMSGLSAPTDGSSEVLIIAAKNKT